jgi:hypothetical protein
MKKKKTYESPRIVYEKKLEVLSAVCDSSRSGFPMCQKSAPCTKLNQ